MRRSSLRIRSLLLALVVALSLTACGEEPMNRPADGDGGGQDGGRGAPTVSRDEFTGRMFQAIDDAGSASVRFEGGAEGQRVSGNGQVQYGEELAMRMTMASRAAEGGSQEVILIGDTIYIGVGDRYASMSLDALSDLGLPDLTSNFDPKAQAKAFDAAVIRFEQKGAAQSLDGVQALPYEITVDPRKAPDTFGAVGSEPLTFTYFIGPDDLPRKMTYRDKDGVFTATFTNWGDSVDIKAPPADKTLRGIG